MKRIRSLVVKLFVAAAIVAGPLALTLQAQNNLEITATIPFPFIMGTWSIAPGSYQFTLTGNPLLLSVRNVKTGHHELFPVHPGSEPVRESKGYLTFQKSDTSNVLTVLHFPGNDGVTQVNRPHSVRGSQTKLSSKSEASSVVGR
ncbi:MAG TPA: hypothetical protein VGN16_14890 [Acidobacteriaceae bacterium]